MAVPPVSNPPPPLTAHGISHAGVKRPQNEDAFGAFVADRLFVVADGMGGQNAGEVASHMAVDHLLAFFRSFHSDPRQAWPYPVDRQQSLGANLLTVGIKVANEKIRTAAESTRTPTRSPRNTTSQTPTKTPTNTPTKMPTKTPTKMACTLVAMAVGDHQLSIAHAGDTRAYRFRDGALARLTTDHSLLAEMFAARPDMPVAELASLSHRNVVTKALGSKPQIEPTLTIKRFQPGDCYLLCSDGLWACVSDETIAEILRSTADIEAACQLLIDAANGAGGPDNVTAVLVRIGG